MRKDLIEVEIRAIAEEEIGSLWDLLYEAVYIPAGVEPPPRSFVHDPSVSRYCEGFGRTGDLAFVLVDGREVVGGAWCRLFSEDCPGYGYIDASTPELTIAVYEPYRGLGFGTQLLQRLIDALRAKNCRHLSLSVDRRNPALRLYERSGFDLVRDDGNACTMVKAL